jgi:hypothetical protein
MLIRRCPAVHQYVSHGFVMSGRRLHCSWLLARRAPTEASAGAWCSCSTPSRRRRRPRARQRQLAPRAPQQPRRPRPPCCVRCSRRQNVRSLLYAVCSVSTFARTTHAAMHAACLTRYRSLRSACTGPCHSECNATCAQAQATLLPRSPQHAARRAAAAAPAAEPAWRVLQEGFTGHAASVKLKDIDRAGDGEGDNIHGELADQEGSGDDEDYAAW